LFNHIRFRIPKRYENEMVGLSPWSCAKTALLLRVYYVCSTASNFVGPAFKLRLWGLGYISTI